MEVEKALLDLPPKPAVRLLALTYLSRARDAAQALGSDDCALHNFRVALRRLRVLLKTYPEYFDHAIRRSDQRALRRLLRSSSKVRDAQVKLELAKSFEIDWLVARLEKEIKDEQPKLQVYRKKFRPMDRRLRRRLSEYRERLDPKRLPDNVAFLSVSLQRVGALGTACKDALESVSLDDQDSLHAVRLRAKQLRFTLEPLATISPPLRGAIGTLAHLQDVMGALRDHELLRRSIVDGGDAESVQSAVAERVDALQSELRRLWMHGNAKWFFERIRDGLGAISPSAVVRPIPLPRSVAAESPWRDPSSV